MRQIDLIEFERSEPVALSVGERSALRQALPSLTFEPAPDSDGTYHVTPSSTVGALEVGGLSVLIEPKTGIPQLLSLACYAMSQFRPQRELFDYPREYALPDVLALALASAARRAFSRGLLHGYRTEEETLHTVRGRIRFDEQIRRRFGVPLPVEVRYDEFTDDILANRLVKAAAARLAMARLRLLHARSDLGRILGVLDNVTLVEFQPKTVPKVRLDRLNEHYREVIALSTLVLKHTAFESDRGTVRASGFLMDMNVVFQEFVTSALREALGVSQRVFLEKSIRSLDVEGQVRLRPDLTWWHGGECLFVGDAKYKNLTGEWVPNGDLYQMLAYVTALGLPGGLLVYAKGEANTVTYHLRHTGKRLKVAALDLSGTLEDILARVGHLADSVKELRDEARGMRAAA